MSAATSTNAPALLTVELLKQLTFEFHMHVNGGSDFSKRIDTNDNWGLAICTVTSGSPHYKVKSKTLYLMADHKVCLDMLKKPWNLPAFVTAVNASRAKKAAKKKGGKA